MKSNFSRGLSVCMLTGLLALSACEKEEDKLTAADSKDIVEEAQVDTYFQDVDDLGTVALDAPSESEYSGGRISTTIVVEDDRFDCEGVIVTIEPGPNSNANDPNGVITVDFGSSGCSDLRGNVRKGKLIFAYDGWRYQPGSTVVVTTDNYYINGVKLEGTRTSVNVSASETDAPKFNVKLVDGKATFADGTTAERESDITWSWVRAESPAMDKLVIHSNSTANGTTRVGRAYEVSLLENIEYQRLCGIAVSGIKKYVIDGDKEVTVNYGDGDCDRTVSLIINGKTTTLSI